MRWRYEDLKREGIVKDRTTLANWIKNPKVKFPAGQLTGPNTRTWDKETEIDPWLESRPIAPKETPTTKRRRGRPRKAHSYAITEQA
jgi:hypothetical protein